MLGVLPIVALAFIVLIVSNIQLKSVMVHVAKEDLAAIAKLEYGNISNWEGNAFSVDSEGNMLNGPNSVSEEIEDIDEIKEQTGVDITIFYGDTRYVTTVQQDGERVLGTKASDVVIEKVLKNGEEYFDDDVEVVNDKYYGYYIPIYNADSDEEPAGMIFAGKSQSEFNSEVMKFIGVFLVTAIIVVLIGIVCISFVTKKISISLRSGVDGLNKIANGDLIHSIEEKAIKGNDETSEIIRALSNLKAELTEIVGKIVKDSRRVFDSATELKKGADDAQNNLVQVDKAIGEIAEGATSQAVDTQNATNQVIAMGDRINQTNENVKHL